MASSSQQLEVIRQLCKVKRLNEDDTFCISKKLLEHYRNVLWMNEEMEQKTGDDSAYGGNGEIREWYHRFRELKSETKRSESIDSLIYHVGRTSCIIGIIDTVKDRLREYHGCGEVYYEILTRSYLNKDKMTDQEVADELALERSTFYRRKKEAILLCGILMWEEARERKMA